MKAAIIGGGPSGLATLKFLRTAHKHFNIDPITVRLFEAEAEIGGTFVHRVYEDAELVSSKYLTAFSDFRLPEDAPDFITPERYVKYLHDYASHFDIWDSIECQAKVDSVTRHGSGHKLVITGTDGFSEEWICDAVAVCSGLNVNPRIPELKGMDKVPVVLHSSEVKGRDQFGKDTNVVILGAGETSMDIAHMAVTSPTNSVTICHKGGFFCAPKVISSPGPNGKMTPGARPNKPVDTSVASLFDTAYAHPVLQRSPLLWFAYDKWIKTMHTLISGTEEGPDQWVGHMSKERKHVDSLFMVKSDRALPYISTGHRSQSLWNKLRTWALNVPIKETKGRTIDVYSWPEEIDNEGFIQVNDECGESHSIKPDVLVLATGYKTEFKFLDTTYPQLSEANVRVIYNERDVTLGFIGFVRPGIGAIPPLAEMQAQLWVLRLLQQHPSTQVSTDRDIDAVDAYEMDWKLHARAGYDLFATKRAVDHESYAYQLALDIGSAPKIWHVMSKGWKVFFTWAMGSNFNPKFRMVGPWKAEETAQEIMSNELYNVVKRSGGGVYLATYTIIPFFIFGSISILLYFIFGIFGFFQGVWDFICGMIRVINLVLTHTQYTRAEDYEVEL